MSKKVLDFNKYKENREIVEKENPQPINEDENTELFKYIISKPILEIKKDNEIDIYQEIKVKFGFMFKGITRVSVVEFRDEFYMIHYLQDVGSFEYLGKVEEILECCMIYIASINRK